MGIPDRIILTLYTFLMAVVAVLVVLCSLGIISATGISSLILKTSDAGKIFVGKNAIEDYISEIAQEVYGVYNVKCETKLDDENISVRINASIEPGINIPETTEEIKYNVRDTIKKVLGMEIKDIELFFKQIKAKN